MDVDPARRHRPAALRVVGPADDGHDPQSLADRRRPASRTSSRRTRGRCRRRRTTVELPLEPYEIATVAATLAATPRTGSRAPRPELAPRGEPAQPVFSDYWLHNKGAAPMGYQPVTVQIRPSFLRGEGPFELPVVVASERTDGAAAGTVALVVPPGWEATPPERIYRLAPGAHLAFEPRSGRQPGAAAGRYFVAARIADEAGQDHEDVVTIDLRPGERRHAPRRPADGRALGGARAGRSSGRSRRPASSPGPADRPTGGRAGTIRGGELAVELLGERGHGRAGRARHVARLAPEPGGERDPRRGPDPQPARDVVDDRARGPRASRSSRARETIVTFGVAPPDDVGRAARTGRWSRSCTSGGSCTRSRSRSTILPPAQPAALLGAVDLRSTLRARRGTEVKMTNEIKVGVLPVGPTHGLAVRCRQSAGGPTSSATTRCGPGTTCTRSRAIGAARSSRAT